MLGILPPAMLESLRPPLELVFAWQTSQFPHGIRRDWGIVILIGILFPICLLAVVLRTRLRVRRRSFGVDDCLIIFAVVRSVITFQTSIKPTNFHVVICHWSRYLYNPWSGISPNIIRNRYDADTVLTGFRLYGYDRHVWDITQPVALQARKVCFPFDCTNSVVPN